MDKVLLHILVMTLRRTRYEATGIEAEFEPGSRGWALRNLPGIRSVRKMNRRQYVALVAVIDRLLDETLVDHRFKADDIRQMHRLWLPEI